MSDATVCCCGCLAGTCVCLSGCLTGIVVGTAIGVLEIVACPVTIPCAIWRHYRYNKWLTDWSQTLSSEDKLICEEYCDGYVSFDSLNRQFEKRTFAVLNTFISSAGRDVDSASEEAKALLKKNDAIPECIRRRARYPWNFMPSKRGFFKMMDIFLMKIKPRGGVTNVDKNRLKELLIESTKICPICMDESNALSTLNSTLTSCNHIFHTECFNTWMTHSKRCPECRSNMI